MEYVENGREDKGKGDWMVVEKQDEGEGGLKAGDGDGDD